MRLGTRGSALAITQAELAARAIGGCEIVRLRTSGDDGAPGDKSRWVDTIEQALVEGRVDLAVHSAKDVPAVLAPGLSLLAALPRAAASDVICGAGGLDELPPGASIGTSSLRRAAQLRAAREDLDVTALGGNVDTRLAALTDPQRALDAVVLAQAGLERLGRTDAIRATLDVGRFVPSPGQGTIVLEGRSGDIDAESAAARAADTDTLAALRAERAVAAALDADCSTPLGAHATVRGDRVTLRAWVGMPDGSSWIRDELEGAAGDPERAGEELAARMRAAGALDLLSRARESR